MLSGRIVLVSFALTLVALFARPHRSTTTLATEGEEAFSRSSIPTTIPLAGFVDAATSNEVLWSSVQGGRGSDTTMVVFLGGIMCTVPQVQALKEAQQVYAAGNPVVALFADPSREVARNVHESRLLKRVSGATFPFLVSTNPELDYRKRGFPTPTVVVVSNGIVVGIQR